MKMIKQIRASFRETCEEDKWGCRVNTKNDAIAKRTAAIQAVMSVIDTEDKGDVWGLISYVLDHGRFYEPNQSDVDELKKRALASTTLTRAMKEKIRTHVDPRAAHSDDEHLIIGSETYDYEDHF